MFLNTQQPRILFQIMYVTTCIIPYILFHNISDYKTRNVDFNYRYRGLEIPMQNNKMNPRD